MNTVTYPRTQVLDRAAEETKRDSLEQSVWSCRSDCDESGCGKNCHGVQVAEGRWHWASVGEVKGQLIRGK